MTRRLACARIMQESNALCPVPTELADFEDSHYLIGDELRAALREGGHEVAGFFRKAELAGFCDGVAARGDMTPVPLLSAQARATDRAYRIGQTKPVFAFNLIVAGSVEERMLALQARKRRLAEALLAQGAAAATALSEGELDDLLAPLAPSA